jgi:microsomal triglyceride transfer protein large subunit
MWKRVLKFADEDTHITKNWFLHSTLLNGTSSAFTRNMGGTPTVNATYGVDMELLSHGNLLKESNFDFLIGDQKHKHHILSVGLFARGLESIAGVPGDGDTEMAGMQLKIMGTQLRPYNLFEGAVQAASHITFGTSKTVFQGNLLISDHEDNTPLINGFVVNQRLRGVLSLDLSGEISGNLIWYKTVHAVVRSKAAALMQGSQSILTSGVNTSVRQLFAFGGATAIETTTDVAFASDPFKMCVKMGEPDHLVLR